MRWLAALLALAVAAHAQPADPEPATDEPKPAPKIELTLNGTLSAIAALRRDQLESSALGSYLGRRDDSFVDPQVSLDLHLRDPSRGVEGVIKAVNRRRVEVARLDGSFDDRFAGSSELELRLEEAYIDLGKLAGPEWTMRAGLQNLRYELRRTGEAMLIHLSRSESPFDGSPLSTGAGVRMTRRGYLIAQPVDVDVFYLKTLETELGDLDEALFGANADLLIRGPADGFDNLITLIGTGFQRGDHYVGTLGAGFDWHSSRFWEYFAEAYGQLGEVEIDRRTRDHEGWAGQLGTRRTWFNLASEPFVELGALAASGRASDRGGTHRDFVSYENVETFKVVEDDDFGFDRDSNYWSLRARAGLDLAPAVGEKVLFELLYGYFRAFEAERGLDEQIGHEVDLRLGWQATESLTVTLGAGALFDSRYYAGRARMLGRDGGDRALLIYIEVALRF